MASRMATHRLERVPSVMPARFPACERSWQGEPPVRMSTRGTVDQSTVVMSPMFGTSGKRWASTLSAPLSISLYQTISVSRTALVPIPRPP